MNVIPSVSSVFARKSLASALFTAVVATAYVLASSFASAQENVAPKFADDKNVPYYSVDALQNADDYQRSQCRLDVLYPENPPEPFATIVWFHGGGLTGGQKYVPSAFRRLRAFKEGRLAIVAAGYRLSPKVSFPVFLEDAAAATAWTLNNIEKYGGNRNAVFVSGGSAGGYLTAMLGAWPKWLKDQGAERSELAGLLPVSGQMTTHFHVKELLKYPGKQYNPVIDENSPLGGISSEFPPVFFILGDRRIEWKCRVEENELMAASLRALGAPLVQFSENEGFTHGISGMGDDIKDELLDEIDDFIEKALKIKSASTGK